MFGMREFNTLANLEPAVPSLHRPSRDMGRHDGDGQAEVVAHHLGKPGQLDRAPRLAVGPAAVAQHAPHWPDGALHPAAPGTPRRRYVLHEHEASPGAEDA